MFFVRAILASLVLVGYLTSAHYVGHGSRDSFGNEYVPSSIFRTELRSISWREVFAHLQPRQSSSSDGRDGPTCRRICGSCGSSCSSTTVSKRVLIDLVTSNGTLLGEYGAESEAHQLLKRSLQNVRQGTISSFLQAKTNALVSTRDNPNTNLINLAYSCESSIFLFGSE